MPILWCVQNHLSSAFAKTGSALSNVRGHNAMCAAIYTSGTSFQCVVKNALNLLASTVRHAILFGTLPAEALHTMTTIVSGLPGLPSRDGATPCSGWQYRDPFWHSICMEIMEVTYGVKVHGHVAVVVLRQVSVRSVHPPSCLSEHNSVALSIHTVGSQGRIVKNCCFNSRAQKEDMDYFGFK
jgi:hypothetical protein